MMESSFEVVLICDIRKKNLKMNKTKLTNSVDFIRELPGTEGSRVRSDALVEQIDDVAVPASLRRRHSFDG